MSTCIHCDTDCGADYIQQAEGTCYAPNARKRKEDRENKKCDACISKMNLVASWDEGENKQSFTRYIYDLYVCPCCGTVEKANTCTDKGSLIIVPDGDFRTTGNMKLKLKGTLSV